MKEKLFNIHKLIGINVLLVFFISIFFGLFTIYKPYIHIWESKDKHFKNIAIEDINLDKCVSKIAEYKKQYPNHKEEKENFIPVLLPNIIFTANNSIALFEKEGIDLNPYTCEEISHKEFEISDFFEKLHYGGIGNILIVFIFGFVSVAVLFLTLTGILIVIKTKYPNRKTKSSKAFFAKYHRLLLIYTIPLIIMFALTGALFNLGVYTSPLITNYLTKGKTSNILELEKNILRDKPLEVKANDEKTKNLELNKLYKEAKAQFGDISFYLMEIYNYKNKNSKVKFIGYEPNNYFVSSVYNETFIVLDAKTGKVISKKMADDGTFTEKLLDSLFYLHFLKTFGDIPRHIFILISFFILVGISFALTLWLSRANKTSFSYKFMRPFSFSIILGSIFGTALLFATTWIIPLEYIYLQELVFYLSFLCIFAYLYVRNNLFLSTKTILIMSSILFFIAFISHWLNSGFSPLRSYMEGLKEVFIMDIALLSLSILLLFLTMKLPIKYFEAYNTKEKNEKTN